MKLLNLVHEQSQPKPDSTVKVSHMSPEELAEFNRACPPITTKREYTPMMGHKFEGNLRKHGRLNYQFRQV